MPLHWTCSCFRSKDQGFGQLTHPPTCGIPGLRRSQPTAGNLLLLFPKPRGSFPTQKCTGMDEDHPPHLSSNLQAAGLWLGDQRASYGGNTGHSWTHLIHLPSSFRSLERSTGVKSKGGDKPLAYEQAKGWSCPLRFLALRMP